MGTLTGQSEVDRIMKLLQLVAIFACCCGIVKANAEFEEYKRMHPEEFSGKAEGDMILPNTRNAYTNIRKWTNGVVPFDLSAMSESAKSKIRAALKVLQTSVGSCIELKERTTERNYISVKNLGGCYSNVGMIGGRQTLSLNERGCLRSGTIQHEFIHALGFMHEQCRSDRDNYLTINYDNIRSGVTHNFRKLKSNNQGLPYEYGSVMHYGKYAFSKNGQPTIVPKKSGVTIGQRSKLHSRDIKMIQLFYGCEAGNGGNGNTGGNGGNTICVDKNASCFAWKMYCQSNQYVKDNCHKTCGTCSK